MKKQKPQKITTHSCSSSTRQKCRKTSSSSFLLSTMVFFFFLMGNTLVNAQETTPPTSSCADPIEVSSTNCGNAVTPNLITGPDLWGSLPASGMLTIGIGLGSGSANFPIDFNCLMDETDPIEELDIRLASSAIVSGPEACMIYLENIYDIRDGSGNVAPNLLTIRAAYAACDMVPPSVTCAEFAMTYSDCPDGLGPNTPNGLWTPLGPSGGINNAVGGSYGLFLDFSTCVTDDLTDIENMEYTLFDSYSEDFVPGCSITLVNEWSIRDECGNVSPDRVIFKGTITYNGIPSLTIDCPANTTAECGQTDPAMTGEATGTASCGDPIITYSDALDSGCGNSGVITRTWTATAPCGSSAIPVTCVQLITVEDTTPPEVTCAEFTETFNRCPDPLGPNSPSGNWISIPASGTFLTAVGGSSIGTIDFNACVTDLCSDLGDMEYMVSDSYEENRIPGCQVDIINEYMVRDACGNVSPTAIIFRGMIRFDGAAPVIICPATVDVECGGSIDPADTGMATATSECGTATVSFSDDITGTATCMEEITRTWTAIDGCGKTSTCVQIITRNCELILDCSLITDEALECRSDLPPVDFDLVTATESCREIIKSALTIIPGNSGCPGDPVIIPRTYFVQDEAGNMQQCMQTFTVESTIPPTIECPADAILACDEDTSPANTGTATGMASCSNFSLDITFSDVSTQGQGCSAYSYVIIRTWSATDGCNRVTTCSQTITVQDLVPPVITCPANVTVECDQPTDPGATGNATASGDNCAADDELTVSFIDVSTQVPTGCGNDNYMITRTWTASDPCGNTSVCTQIITVEDTTPPTIVCAANTTIECDEDTSPANTGMATGIDNCSAPDEVVVTFADVSTQGAAGCTQYMYTITRTWTATDACGNFSTCVQTINVEDTTPPVITCPVDLTIECDEDTSPANTGIATGTDNCSADAEIVITFADVSTQGTVGCAKYQYMITRTWTATDACGNSSTCVQTVNVDDTTAPVITCPANENLDCLSGPIPVANTIDEFLALGGTGMDNCSTADEWTITFGDSPGSRDLLDYCSSNPADRTVTREYRIADACGNVSTCIQTFTFSQSVIGPVITEIPLDQTISCASEAMAELAAFNAETDCGLGSTKSVEALTPTGTANCPGARYSFRYTVEDACGRTASHTQTYTIQNETFEYICPNITCEIDCDATAEEAIAAFDAYTQNAIFVTSCTNLDPVVSYNFNPNSLGGCGSQTTVNFTATDPCGRSASCASTIVVVDNEAPVISGDIPSAFRNCGAFANSDYQSWGQEAMNSVEIDNNCDNTITWSYSPNTPNAENCGTGGISTTIVTFTATDNCGNASTTSAKFYLKDAPVSNLNMTVSGHLRTENDEMVELVDIKASGSDMEEEMETGDDGYFEFELPSENNYTVIPTRNDDPLNGISTMDLILISQHVLGVQELDSPYKLIAADVNNSGDITAFDMIALRKMILLIDEEFENNTSWRFVSEDYIFANPTNPFASTFPENYSINDLEQNEVADFIAVKVGDVNGTAIPNQLVSGDTRDELQDLNFTIRNQKLVAGEAYTVDFKAKDFIMVQGYQMSLNFDQDALEFVDLVPGELSSMTGKNFGLSHLSKGVITHSWNQRAALSLEDDAVLFSLQFKAKSAARLSEAIQLSKGFTPGEAYSSIDGLMDVALDFESDKGGVNDVFDLYQNTPNPFRSETTIGFYLPEASDAKFSVYDLTGRTLLELDGNYQAGYNEVVISTADLKGANIMYYKLSLADRSKVKRMVMLKE